MFTKERKTIPDFMQAPGTPSNDKVKYRHKQNIKYLFDITLLDN